MHAYAVQLSLERKALVLVLCATLCTASLRNSLIFAIPDVSWLWQLVAVIGMQVHKIFDLPKHETSRNRCTAALC